MSDNGFYIDGRGVGGEAPPRSYDGITLHPPGRIERKILDKIYAPTDAKLYGYADRLAEKLGIIDPTWPNRVVAVAKRVKRHGALLRVAVGAYAISQRPADEILRAVQEMDNKGVLSKANVYTLFSIANHNAIRVLHKSASDLYPLSKYVWVDLRLRACGPRTYDQVNLRYHYFITKYEAENTGSSPRTTAKRALQAALDMVCPAIRMNEVF